jgi:hypothetical protein
MAKESGIGISVAIDDSAGAAKTISNDITDLDFATPRGVMDSTGLDSSANERILLLADFSVTVNGIFNDATDRIHDVFKTVSSTSVTRTVTIAHSGQTLPNEAIFTDYQLSRSNTGELTVTAPGALNSTTVPTWA